MKEKRTRLDAPPRQPPFLPPSEEPKDRTNLIHFLTIFAWVVFAAITVGGFVALGIGSHSGDPKRGLTLFLAILGIGFAATLFFHLLIQRSAEGMVGRFYGFRRMRPEEEIENLREDAYDRALWLTREHRYEAAIEEYKKIMREYLTTPDLKPYFKIGEIYEEHLNDPGHARKAYQRVLFVAARHAELKDHPLAREAHRRLSHLRGQDTDPELERMNRLLRSGDEFMLAENYEAAFEKYRLASQLELSNMKALLGCARALARLGRFKEADTWLTHARELDPKEPRVHRLQAEIHEARGDREAAIAEWEACIAKADLHDMPLISQARHALENLRSGDPRPLPSSASMPVAVQEEEVGSDSATAIYFPPDLETQAASLPSEESETSGSPLRREASQGEAGETIGAADLVAAETPIPQLVAEETTGNEEEAEPRQPDLDEAALVIEEALPPERGCDDVPAPLDETALVIEETPIPQLVAEETFESEGEPEEEAPPLAELLETPARTVPLATGPLDKGEETEPLPLEEFLEDFTASGRRDRGKEDAKSPEGGKGGKGE